jgi:hypothetical protein
MSNLTYSSVFFNFSSQLNYTSEFDFTMPAVTCWDLGLSFIYLVGLYICSILGMISSIYILVLSAFSSELKGDYKIFVINVAVVNFITETSWIIFLSCHFFYHSSNCSTFVYKIMGFLFSLWYYSSPLSMLVFLPGTVGRYILFRKINGRVQYLKYFTPAKICLYLFTVDVLAYSVVAIQFIPVLSYQFMMWFDYLVLPILFVFCYFLVAFFSLQLFIIMRKLPRATSLGDRTPEEERKNVANGFLLLACVPIIDQIPQLIFQILKLIGFILIKSESTVDLISTTFINITGSIFYFALILNPVIDAMIVVIVLIPYRKALLKSLSCLSVFKVKPVLQVTPLNHERQV